MMTMTKQRPTCEILCFFLKITTLQDSESATVAMHAMQSTALPSSDKGPMRIEYAKNQMFIKKAEMGEDGEPLA